MGVNNNVGYDYFPRQGSWLNKKVAVCFNYDTSKVVIGTIVREDTDEPGVMIIALCDGRYVLPTECQYSLVKEGM